MNSNGAAKTEMSNGCTVVKKDMGEKELVQTKGAADSNQNDEGSNGNERRKEEADGLIAQGRREYLIRDYTSAVDTLATACEIYSQIFGEKSDEMGDVYLIYGKALFHSAREATDVFGDKLETDKNDEDDEDCDEREEKEESKKGAESAEEGVKKISKNVEEGPEESSEEQNEEPEDIEEAENEVHEDDDEESGSDLNDMQLAWQILEMAKIVFLNQLPDSKSAEIPLKMSEVYFTLGEIGLETENYENAVADLNQCLDLQRQHLEADARLIAETLFEIGNAHFLCDNYDEAVCSFEECIAQLQRRMDSLKVGMVEANKSDADTNDANQDSYSKMEKEYVGIEEVIGDIKEKIADTLESKRVTKEKLKTKLGFGSSVGTSSNLGASSSTQPVASNIGHLIKKRKCEDPCGVDDKTPVEKKIKT